MAKIAQFQYRNSDDYQDYMNVTAVVGRNNAVNHPDDVLIIQALLAYMDPERSGLAPGEYPAVTGTFDPLTAKAILKYQEIYNNRGNRRSHYKVIKDGRVSPALGKFAYGRSTYVWTIIGLNLDARETGARLGSDKDVGYINDICEIWPQVKVALKIPGK